MPTRAETRRAEFDRIHGEVLKSRTIRDLWLTYGRHRFKPFKGLKPDEFDTDPVFGATVKHAFYSGVAALLELMSRVAEDDITEEQGVEMLTRLREEMTAFVDQTTN